MPLNSIDKSCYKDELVVLSGGAYSNVSAKDLGLDEDDWINKSIKIRTFHELTNFAGIGCATLALKSVVDGKCGTAIDDGVDRFLCD